MSKDALAQCSEIKSRLSQCFMGAIDDCSKWVAYVEGGWCVLRRGLRKSQQLFRRHYSKGTRLTRISTTAVKSHDGALHFSCAIQLFTALRSEWVMEGDEDREDEKHAQM